MTIIPRMITVMTTHTPIPTAEADLLALAQWLSPAFPVGGFAYSQGLEVAMARGEVACAETLHAWVGDVIRFGAGRSDAVLLVHARAPDADLPALADLARALAPSAERLAEAVDQGATFVAQISAITGRVAPCAMPLPVAAGWATQPLSLPDPVVVGFWLQTLAAQLISAAVRYVPLGQTAGQGVLARLAPTIAVAARHAAEASLDDIATAVPRADMASMLHETLQPRIFRT